MLDKQQCLFKTMLDQQQCLFKRMLLAKRML
jgi:hypothetical protein